MSYSWNPPKPPLLFFVPQAATKDSQNQAHDFDLQ